MKSVFSIFLIIIGVIISTLSASFIPIKWLIFTIGIFFTTIGIVLHRNLLKKKLTTVESNKQSFEEFVKMIELLREKTEYYANNLTSKDILTIDDDVNDLMPEVETFRFAITEKVGITGYTEIISIYSKAERLIRRGISATIDEYLNDGKENFSNSLFLLDKTLLLIKKYSEKNNG